MVFYTEWDFLGHELWCTFRKVLRLGYTHSHTDGSTDEIGIGKSAGYYSM